MFIVLLIAKIVLLWLAIYIDAKVVATPWVNRQMQAFDLALASTVTTAFIALQYWL